MRNVKILLVHLNSHLNNFPMVDTLEIYSEKSGKLFANHCSLKCNLAPLITSNTT